MLKIALEAAIATQQPLILEPPHRLADPELAHRCLPRFALCRHPGEGRDPP